MTAWSSLATPGPGRADGTGAQARFGTITGLTSDGLRLYVTDATERRIRTLD